MGQSAPRSQCFSASGQFAGGEAEESTSSCQDEEPGLTAIPRRAGV